MSLCVCVCVCVMARILQCEICLRLHAPHGVIKVKENLGKCVQAVSTAPQFTKGRALHSTAQHSTAQRHNILQLKANVLVYPMSTIGLHG
jgi:hypothetical protein